MTGKKSKIVSVALIVLMLSAIFGALPAILSGASESDDGTLTLTIINDSGDAVPAGYKVNIYDIYSDSMSSYSLSTDGYLRIDMPQGHYQIELPAQELEGKAYFRANSGVFSVNSGKTSSLGLQVTAKDLAYTISGTVSFGENTVNGTTVTMSNYSSGFSTSTTTNETGYYSLSVYGGNFSFWAEKKGTGRFYKTVKNVNADDRSLDVSLANAPYLKGFVFDENGNGVENVLHISVFNNSNKEIIRMDNTTGPFFKVPLCNGNFSVLIASEGYSAYYNASIIINGTDRDLENITIESIPKSTDSTSFTFEDFQNLEMTRTIEYAPYHTINALGMTDSANLRYQIDSDHDGIVNVSEAKNFENWTESGMLPISTGNGLTVNGISYTVKGTPTVRVSNAEGIVNSTTPISISISASFNTSENISGETVKVGSNVNYDTENIDYSYSITLPAGYERSTTNAASDIVIENYTTISINPGAGNGSADVSFDAVESEKGDASIYVPTGEYVYERTDMNDTYIVRAGKNVALNAVFSDPNGHESDANYTWDIDRDAEYGQNIEYNFTDGKEYTVNLTVTDVGGEKTYAEITIQADNKDPTADMGTVPSSVNEKESIEFKANESSDTIFGNEKINILSYLWDFGDGNMSVQKVADHAYAVWGTYHVTLNVSDMVGHYNKIGTDITVKDITPPTVLFNWTGADNATHSSSDTGTASVTKGDRVSFDASPSFDPKGFDGSSHAMTYSWYFEDTGMSDSGKTVDHTFSDVGTYSVKLNISDSKGNYNEVVKIFEVKNGPVPRLEVKNLTLSTDAPRAGDTIQIIANISNFGDSDANSPTVIFYVNDNALSGTPTFYVYENGSLVEANHTIPANGGYRVVKMDWRPDKGSVSLKVNASDASEPSLSYLNEKEIKVTVGSPVWMDYIPAILAVIAIVGVIGIYLMYSKGIGPFSTESKSKNKTSKKK